MTEQFSTPEIEALKQEYEAIKAKLQKAYFPLLAQLREQAGLTKEKMLEYILDLGSKDERFAPKTAKDIDYTPELLDQITLILSEQVKFRERLDSLKENPSPKPQPQKKILI